MKLKYNKKNKLSILGDTKKEIRKLLFVILKSYISTLPERGKSKHLSFNREQNGYGNPKFGK